jgi:hypothetical protein
VRPKFGTVTFGVSYSDEPEDAAHPILEFDPKTQSLKLSTWKGRAPIDFDASGTQLLHRGLGVGFTLFRFSDGTSVRLGSGYFDAVW